MGSGMDNPNGYLTAGYEVVGVSLGSVLLTAAGRRVLDRRAVLPRFPELGGDANRVYRRGRYDLRRWL